MVVEDDFPIGFNDIEAIILSPFIALYIILKEAWQKIKCDIIKTDITLKKKDAMIMFIFWIIQNTTLVMILWNEHPFWIVVTLFMVSCLVWIVGIMIAFIILEYIYGGEE